MKIAMIARKMNVRGGVQRHVLSLAKELKARGHDLTIYTFSYKADDCYPDLLKGMHVVSLDGKPPRWRFGIWSLMDEYTAAKRLALLIDRETEILNPDHATYRVAYYYKKLVKNIPSVWMMHDMPTKRYSGMREGASHGHALFLRRMMNILYDWYERYRFIRMQDVIMVHSDGDAKRVKKSFARDAVVVRSGIDPAYFSFHKRDPPTKSRIKILMNGIFLPHRRFEDGIEAVSMLKKAGYGVHLSIIGDYDFDRSYYRALQALVRERGVDREVMFLGRVSEEELLHQYHANNIFLFPNHLQSWGLAVFEAIASGMPTVVSKTAGAAEVLVDKENALLVNPKDPEEITGAVRRLTENPDEYRRLSGNGRAFVEKNLSWAVLADQMERIFLPPH